MDHPHTPSLLPALPICGISFPSNEFLSAALEYTKAHTSPTTVNHCLRSAAFALLCIRKLNHLAAADKDLVVFSCIFHDMGWATTKSLISEDKRFEVDGANIARSWVREHSSKDGRVPWDERQIQLSWDAIALHTTVSIAQHKEVEVAATNLGITADFLGARLPGGIITVEEQKEIVRAFPRLGFHDEVIQILCGFCKKKPETTYDNFVCNFGLKYGLDGKGEQKEEFTKAVQENLIVNRIMGSLRACEEDEN